MSTVPKTPLRILVVDDRPELLMTYKMALSDPETQLVLVSNGEAALHEVKNHSFNLIILDVDMPQMDGFEVCRRLRAENHAHHIPVIFVTGRASTATEHQAATLEAADFLTKPFDLRRLKSSIQRCAIR